MLTKDMRKTEIESFLNGKGEFIQIDYLNRYLKLMPPIEMRKFAYLKLAEIYGQKRMFFDAAKAYKEVGNNCLNTKEKVGYCIKEAESYLKAGEFFEADKSIKKAILQAEVREKTEIASTFKQFCKEYAENLVKDFKSSQATKLYEKMLTMNLTETEKKEIKERLMNLYEKLGKFNEAKHLRGN